MYQVSPFKLAIIIRKAKEKFVILLYYILWNTPVQKLGIHVFRASFGLRYIILLLYVLYLPHHNFCRRLVTE
jgi:hypothetical protein